MHRSQAAGFLVNTPVERTISSVTKNRMITFDFNGYSLDEQAFMMAVVNDCPKVVEYWLHQGVDINTVFCEHKTCSSFAPHYLQGKRMTVLGMALERGQVAMVRHLIGLGADVNHRYFDYDNWLQHAVAHTNRSENLMDLLKAGAIDDHNTYQHFFKKGSQDVRFQLQYWPAIVRAMSSWSVDYLLDNDKENRELLEGSSKNTKNFLEWSREREFPLLPKLEDSEEIKDYTAYALTFYSASPSVLHVMLRLAGPKVMAEICTRENITWPLLYKQSEKLLVFMQEGDLRWKVQDLIQGNRKMWCWRAVLVGLQMQLQLKQNEKGKDFKFVHVSFK